MTMHAVLAAGGVALFIVGCEGGPPLDSARRALARAASSSLTASASCDPANPAVAAHPIHQRDTPIRSALACYECHASMATSCGQSDGPKVTWGALATARGADPSWDPAARTCSGVHCHGATMVTPPATPWQWAYTDPDFTRLPSQVCSICHGYPPPSPHPQDAGACAGCHPKTVLADGTIDLAQGNHIDGAIEYGGTGTGCDGCHGYPPATGAHLIHFGLKGAANGERYGDTSILRDRFADAEPTSAPHVYAFGCGNCHPLDPANHFNGKRDVVLHESSAPTGSLKARNSASASFDPATGVCSGVYCHSGGEENPAFGITPPWTSGPHLGCNECHKNPPRYRSGAEGSSTANSHVGIEGDTVFGHFGGLPGPSHGSRHNGVYGFISEPIQYASPITCQTCHYATVDPSNTGRSGFYYLDTSGDYQFPGATFPMWSCSGCHTGKEGEPPTGKGRVLPLFHVNGDRDVVFDPRKSINETPQNIIPWAQFGADTPTRPIFVTNGHVGVTSPDAVRNGLTLSAHLESARYWPETKTCTNVSCHLTQPSVTWGGPPGDCWDCHSP